MCWNPCAYLPGYAEKQARGMFPGIAKTDAIDAEVIARTALGVPRALRLAEFGGAAGCSAAGWRRFSNAARRALRPLIARRKIANPLD